MVTIRKIKQQALKSHAQFYRQGGRDAYALVMDLETLDSILPTPPPEASTKIVGNNRRFHMPHTQAIADYLYKKSDWVLGSIVLGINPRYVQFDPYEESGSPSESLGEFRITLVGGISSLEILDGQHRRMAIRLALRRLENDIRTLEQTNKNGNSVSGKRQAELMDRLESLKRMSIPVSVYAEPETKNRARMFADLAQTRNIDPITKARFNDRDPFNRAAFKIVEGDLSELLSGKIEMEKSTPPRDSDNLLSLNQLSRCLSILQYGYGSRVSRARVQESEGNFDEIVDTGIAWADKFLPSARKEYEELCSIELEEGFVSNNRSKFVAFRATIFQLMAGCFYKWATFQTEWDGLADWLREADFDLRSEECIFRKPGMVTTGDPTLVSRRQEMQATIDYIVDQAFLANS